MSLNQAVQVIDPFRNQNRQFSIDLRLLSEISGRDIKAQNMPAWLLRTMGTMGDIIGKLTGRQFQLTREAAEVLTRSVPLDSQQAIDELGLELVGAEKSFYDLIQWMVETGRLDPAKVRPRMPQPGSNNE